MKRFILHVGFHKTATSSIQETLAINKINLDDQGFYYPIFEVNGRKIVNHSIPFYSAYCNAPEKYNINIMNGDCDRIEEVNALYMAEIERLMLVDKSVIVSGEDLSVLPPAALTSIKNKIIENGFNLEVYCSVRKPYSFLCSELQERIKAGVATLKDITVPKKSSCIQKLKNVFGNAVTFSSFEADCINGDPVKLFLERIGVNSTSLKIIGNNEGLGNITTRLYAHLNITHPVVLNGRVNEKGRLRFLNNFDSNKFLLTQAEYRKIEAELTEEMSKIKDMLSDEYIDTAIKFCEKVTVNKNLADQIYSDINQSGRLSVPILKFINRHCDFDITDYLHSKNANLLRDLGLILNKKNPEKSLKFFERALFLRPQGPKIKAELEQLKNSKVKLVAIAKDEGAYIAEWIFHHLYFGFDAIDVYVNNTTDNTKEIVEKISKVYPSVCLKDGDVFFKGNSNNPQIDVYKHALSESKNSSFTHVMFLDIDEFFTSKNLNKSIDDAISSIDSDVINFEWIVKVKEDERFSKPFQDIIYGNFNRHIKSLIDIRKIANLKYDLSVHNIVAKQLSYKLADGSPFEVDTNLNKIKAYSLLSDKLFDKKLKPYFVVHRMFRSQMEYVSLLGRGRPNKDVRLKDNRQGYSLNKSDLTIKLPPKVVSEYNKALNYFITKTKIESDLKVAKDFILERFNAVMEVIQNPHKEEVKIIHKVTKNLEQLLKK